MKLTVLQENLSQTISILTKAIPSKPSLPILSSIKLTATNASCSACATDLYFGVDTSMAAQVQSPGSAVVPGKQFKEILNSLPAGPLKISYADGTVTIESGKSKTSLQCQPTEEYPPFPEVTGAKISIESSVLATIDSQVAFAASNDVARPVLTSILFAVGIENSRIVATDGFRLAVLDVRTGITAESDTTMLLPAKAVSEVSRLANQLGVEVVQCEVSEELKQARFSVADVSVYVRLIEGQYPPYEKIIPSESASRVIFDVPELQNHIKRALVFARESSNIIKFLVQSDKVEVNATSALVGTYNGQLEQAQSNGEPIEIAFNAKYIQDFISSIKAESIKMEMTESLKPVKITAADLAGYQYIVMPFKVAG